MPRRRRHRRRRIRSPAGQSRRPISRCSRRRASRSSSPTMPPACTRRALVPDGGTLQLGIGSLGDAVAQALILRHRNNDDFRELVVAARSARAAPLGTAPRARHSTPASTAAARCSSRVSSISCAAGILKREVDGARAACGILRRLARILPGAAGDAGGRAAPIADDGDLLRQRALWRRGAAKRRARVKARFINNAMMATLLGAVVSDALGGRPGRERRRRPIQFRRAGFCAGRMRARSSCCAPTARRKGAAQSNIRWNYGHTTIPRHLRDIVVTEYGIADLRGKSDRDVIAAMLAITDSRFQDELLRAARRTPGRSSAALNCRTACRDNTPERIATRACARARCGAAAAVSVRHAISPTSSSSCCRRCASAHVLAPAACRTYYRGLFFIPPVGANAAMPRPHGLRAAGAFDGPCLCRPAHPARSYARLSFVAVRNSAQV